MYPTYLSKFEQDQVPLTLPAGRRGKKITLRFDRLTANNPNDYFINRRLLGIILYTVRLHRGHHKLRKFLSHPLEVYIPVSTTMFLLRYDGVNLSIGCYKFSAGVTRKIVRWSQMGI